MCIRDRSFSPQQLDCILALCKGQAVPEEQRQTLAGVPVSYTHLDVYKRQEPVDVNGEKQKADRPHEIRDFGQAAQIVFFLHDRNVLRW